jgi:hypothetical protein
MIVITSRDKEIAGDKVCQLCHSVPKPPSLYWDGPAGELHICERCCNNIRQGLVADLIHITAISELNKAGYCFQTFDRTTPAEIEEHIPPYAVRRVRA